MNEDEVGVWSNYPKRFAFGVRCSPAEGQIKTHAGYKQKLCAVIRYDTIGLRYGGLTCADGMGDAEFAGVENAGVEIVAP